MALQTAKSGMPVIISSCSHKTFYAKCRYNGCKPDVKKSIIKWAADGAGIRSTAGELGASTDTVTKELKKKKD
jgi:transposase-like protein